MIIYLDRLRRQTAAAVATAPKWVVHSCLALLLELISSDAFSIVKYNMLSLFVFRRLLGSFFEQRGEASVSMSFRINSVISFWTEDFSMWRGRFACMLHERAFYQVILSLAEVFFWLPLTAIGLSQTHPLFLPWFLLLWLVSIKSYLNSIEYSIRV